MNNLRYLSLFLFFSSLTFADNSIIREKLKSVLPPEAQIESIEPSEIKDIFKVYYGDPQPIYITSDKIYGSLTPWQKTKVARHPSRPHLKDYLETLFESFIFNNKS